jgi:hypothetical protein
MNRNANPLPGLSRLAHPELVHDVSPYDNEHWLAQIRLDGVRMAVVWGEDGTSYPSHAVTKGGRMVLPPDGLPKLDQGTVIDGELVLHDDLKLSLSLLNSGRYSRESWRPFDLACNGRWGVSSLDFADRLTLLQDAGLDPLEAGRPGGMWNRAMERGHEGIVVRPTVGGYLDACYKIKPKIIVTCIALKGKLLMLSDDGRAVAVGTAATNVEDGLYEVQIEGAYASNRLRAPRIVGPAAAARLPLLSQLSFLRHSGRLPN